MTTTFGAAAPPALHVMTFNVRRRMDGLSWRRADRWRIRRPLVTRLLRTEAPTIVGVQEALPDQARAVQAALGPRYRMLGRGRDRRGRGEGTPLYYDADRLRLRTWEQVALSGRPRRAGSRSWGNLLPRVAVLASFDDRATGASVFAVNTHLDPFSPRSRVRAAAALRSLVAAQDLPAVVMGDMNARPGSPALREFTRAGVLVDAWAGAARRRSPEWGTNPNYRPPRVGGARIDWILVTPDVEVTDAAIHGWPADGPWASDHLPVQALIRLPEGATP
ncbi:endonuclease/exonuclease/phosphatase family protein [Microbacterium sp. GXF7504]